MKKVEAPENHHVTFCKRKKGLFQKADKLSSLTGTEVAVVVVSESGRVFDFGTPSCDAVADRYLAGFSPNQNANSQNHGISCDDDSGSMILESIPSTSSKCSLNKNVQYQNNGAVNGAMIVQTTPGKGLFQKADELSSLTGTEVAVVVVSESGRVFDFGTPSCDAVADRYLAGFSPNQNANSQNHGISCDDDSGSMILESIPSTSSKCYLNKNVQYQNNGAVNGAMIVQTTPGKGLFQKADKLSSLTGTEVAVVVVSESGRVFDFGTPSCDAVADRYLAGFSPNQNANSQNHGISCDDDSGSMILESIPSTSSKCYLNKNVQYQNNGAVNGAMIVQTTPGSLIRVLEDNILDSYNLELAPNGNADFPKDSAAVGTVIIENTPLHSSFLQSDGVDVGSKLAETTPLSSSCSEIRVLEDDILVDGYSDLMNDTISPAEPCENLEAGEMSGEMIGEMIEELMEDKEEVPACNEFLTNLVSILLPTTASNYYTSLLVMEDEDEVLVDNRGLGTCYFNPYND